MASRVGGFAWENLLKGGKAIVLEVHHLYLQVWYVEATAGEGSREGYMSGMWGGERSRPSKMYTPESTLVSSNRF